MDRFKGNWTVVKTYCYVRLSLIWLLSLETILLLEKKNLFKSHTRILISPLTNPPANLQQSVFVNVLLQQLSLETKAPQRNLTIPELNSQSSPDSKPKANSRVFKISNPPLLVFHWLSSTEWTEGTIHAGRGERVAGRDPATNSEGVGWCQERREFAGGVRHWHYFRTD